MNDLKVKTLPQTTPLIKPGVFAEILAAIVANAARDLKQAKALVK